MLTRTLRRTGLPLAYSAGFHPKPILSFGPPLPLGVESEAEYFDLELTRALPEEEVTAGFSATSSAGDGSAHRLEVSAEDPVLNGGNHQYFLPVCVAAEKTAHRRSS